ncbi:hypothetical protein PG984_016144 [Apiospora sp. TS-2023a]
MHSKRLFQKMYHGFDGGLFWETVPEFNEKRNVYTTRSLLNSTDMNRFNRCLKRTCQLPAGQRLPDLKKATISQALGLIYERASYNVGQCAEMEPVAFFADMMKAFPFAQCIPPGLFWKFTYRALMARDIFMEYQAGWKHAPLHPMIENLDKYRKAFYKRYDQTYGVEYLSRPIKERDPAVLEEITKIRTVNLTVKEKYFDCSLTCHEYSGDGTDKLFDLEEESVFGHMKKKKKEEDVEMTDAPADPDERQNRGLQEGWAREDGSANPDYVNDEIRELILRPTYDSDDESEQSDDEGDERDDEDDDDEEEYRTWLHDYELEYDIYMGRHARNPEEDTEMSGELSKLDMKDS